MDLQVAIAKKEDIEQEIAQKLNRFMGETELIIERIEVDEKFPRAHGRKDAVLITITLDVRL